MSPQHTEIFCLQGGASKAQTQNFCGPIKSQLAGFSLLFAHSGPSAQSERPLSARNGSCQEHYPCLDDEEQRGQTYKTNTNHRHRFFI